ncbi:hypothetical protein QFC20_001762 [Naganishia adeliensis]|uniref:Uncharacterized protein n=1 Tax=Naganishia adeliensis TaxID=92952 RepID=A0ACC2WQ28_9TREE|nr:hypothetical protein QFC20_001762 [Naganishia adeliensis]
MTKLATGTSLATPKGEKLEEMFDTASRLITYTTKRDATNTTSISTESLLGFAAIRFDTEDTLDSQEYEDGVRTTVVYIYEMQVSSSARGQGLGGRLLRDCESLAKGTGMQKAMLTCLKNNEQGLGFYHHNGYAPDEIDPTLLIQQEQSRKLRSKRSKTTEHDWVRGREADTKQTMHIDYRILSKRIL